MRILIMGAGEVGFSLARHLTREKQDVVVIETNASRCHRVQESLDIQVLKGNGASPALLEEVGIASVDMFLAVSNSDEVNMVACQNVAALSPKTHRISRIRSMDYLKLLEKHGSTRMGIDQVINPEIVAADRIMRMLQVPAAQDVRDFAQGKVRLTAFNIEPGAPAAGRKLMTLAKEENLDTVLVVSIERDGKIVIPHGNTELQEGDYVWTFCKPDRVADAARLAGKKYFPLRKVCVFGGTSVGYHLVRSLVEADIPVKVIEPDREQCEDLAATFPQIVALHGQAIDLKLLQEENIGDSSTFVAATNDDEENLLSALLARKEGVPKVIALMERTDYQSVISTIGVSNIVSSNMTAVGMILSHIRKGRILSSSLIGSHAEVMEYAVGEDSEITRTPLMKLRFPRGAILGAIVRNEQVIIPKGSDQVIAGDKVLIFALNDVIHKVERLLTEKKS